jgi:CubicO group peptidase (beta-lactamase class C family)
MWSVVRNQLRLADTTENLAQVSCIDREQEVEAAEVGLSEKARDAIWSATEALYLTGTQPGISLCIRKRGKIFMNRCIGYASGNGPGDLKHEHERLMRLDTPVCLYSASKAVTAVLIHKLAEDGLVNLLDPVSYYLPEFARKGKQPITIHQVLSHRGGIPGLPINESLDTLFDPDQVWQLLCDAKPIAVDGGTLAYHAITGGFVLGRLIEAVTGLSAQDYLDKVLRKPLKMTYFRFGLEKKYQHIAARNYATGLETPFPLSLLVKRALGASMTMAAEVSNDRRWMNAVVPAGNMYATAEEISRMFEMMRDQGRWQRKQVLAPVTIQRAIQEYGSLTLDRTMLIPMRYSAGMMLGGEPFGLYGTHTGRAYGHLGLINKFAWADPDRDISVGLLTTGLSLVGHHLPALAKLIHRISYDCR